jgi:hypothetical protein
MDDFWMFFPILFALLFMLKAVSGRGHWGYRHGGWCCGWWMWWAWPVMLIGYGLSIILDALNEESGEKPKRKRGEKRKNDEIWI